MASRTGRVQRVTTTILWCITDCNPERVQTETKAGPFRNILERRNERPENFSGSAYWTSAAALVIVVLWRQVGSQVPETTGAEHQATPGAAASGQRASIVSHGILRCPRS